MCKKLIVLLLLIGISTQILAQRKLLLVIKGKSDYKIVVPDSANEIELQSATVLQNYINKISGCILPILKLHPATTKGHWIIVGRNKEINKEDSTNLGSDGLVIKKVNHSLILSGGFRKGTLYSVYTFIESFLGCKMFTSGSTYLPQASSITLPAVIYTKQVPTFERRTTFFEDALNKNYCDFHKMNYFLEDWGLWVHSFEVLVPKEKYFKSNPEYFALINGQRNADQLCLTNPEILKVVIANLQNLIKKKPDAKYWSVSQNDNDNFCQCANCTRLNEEQNSLNGSVLSFVNNVAQHFSNKVITTLAYRKTETPPKTIKPLDNVLVMLCTSYDERRVPLKEQTIGGFNTHFNNWSAITKKLFIWDYIVPFANSLCPFPNYYTIQPNLKYFSSKNVTEIFLNGIGDFPGEFSELRCYMVSRIMWNTETDVKATMKEFIDGYYGHQGGVFISRYINLLNQNASLKPVGVRSGGGPADAINSYLSLENIRTYKRIFDAAIKQIKDSVYSARIMKEYVCVLFAELEINKALHLENKTATIDTKASADLLNDFYEKLKKLKIIYLNEARMTADDYYNSYNNQINNK